MALNGGVHDDDAAAGGRRQLDIVDADAGAAHRLEPVGAAQKLVGDLGGGSDGEPVIIADAGEKGLLVGAELRLVVDREAAVAHDLNRGFAQPVGDQHACCHEHRFPSAITLSWA
jgi:hypothetical protein